MKAIRVFPRVGIAIAALAAIQSVTFGQSELIGLVDFSQDTSLLVDRNRPVRIRYAAQFEGFDVTREYSVQPGTATGLLNGFRSLGEVFVSTVFDGGEPIETTLVHVVPREVANLPLEVQQQCLEFTYERSRGSVRMLINDPDRRDEFLQARVFDDPGTLHQSWDDLTTRPGTRFLAFNGVVVVQLGAENAAERRATALTNAGAAAVVFNNAVRNAEMLLDAQNREVARIYSNDTSSVFRQLEREGLMNDRLQIYQTAWEHQYRPAVLSGFVSPAVFSGLHSFNESLALATPNNTCTTYVTGTGVAGATVQYAVPADADRDNWTQAPGPTMEVIDLPRGFYKFRLLRPDEDGVDQETGRTDKIDCNASSRGVQVPE